MNVHAPIFQAQPWDGQPIDTPGVYANVPIETYHSKLCVADAEISSSGLRQIESQSPAHYWHGSYLNPAAEPRKPTQYMTFGSAAHHLILGEDHFDKRFIVRPETLGVDKKGEPWAWNGNRNDCKAWLAEAEASGLTVLTTSDMERIEGIATALDRHPIAGDFLRGLIETSLIDFEDIELPDGRRLRVGLKSRPDVLPSHGPIIGDLKVTAGMGGAAPTEVEKKLESMGYAIQGGLAARAVKRLMGVQVEDVVLITAEADPPHVVSVTRIGDETLFLGLRRAMTTLKTFARCVLDEDWPGYPDDGRNITYAPWIVKRLEEREAAGELETIPGDEL